MNIKSYLKYSSIAAIFLEVIQFHYIIDLRLSYIIILFNSLLIAFYSIRLNYRNLIIFFFLGIHGALGVLLIQYPLTALISQLIGITILSIYFYNLVKLIGYKELFKTYAIFSFYICVLGLIMFFTNITVWDPYRLHSILNEPSRFVIIVLPSVYYFFKEKKYFKFSIILISLLLAQSSIGYIGLLLFLILPNLKIRVIKKFIYLLPLLVVALWFLSKNENFKLRYNQTIDAVSVFKTKVFAPDINISSYALLSNTYTSFENFKEYPLGTGLGSHKTRYNYYISNLEKPPYIVNLGLDNINSEDANSLFLRMVTDFGVFGIIVIFYFIVICLKSYRFYSFEAVIAQSLVVYFFLKLLRQGHYFPQEFYLFLWIFIFAYRETREMNKLKTK